MRDDSIGELSSGHNDREVAERTTSHHSSEYLKRALAEIERVEPGALSRCAKILDCRLIYIVVETPIEDEAFHLVSDNNRVWVSTVDQRDKPAVSLRLTPEVISNILQGELTPVEAFFMGRLRARGTTQSLYTFLEFFIAVAQVGVTVPATLELILEFETMKRNLGSECP